MDGSQKVVRFSMRTHLFRISIPLCLLLFPAANVFSLEVPKERGGFRLGEDITKYLDIQYSNYLKEVVVTDWHGFRKGVISYGICASPGKIVRISMKYEDPSKPFYEEPLKRFKKRFGKPSIWGDAFGILYKWKWVFYDEHNERVHLILQHNLQNHHENIGNLVKLYYPERGRKTAGRGSQADELGFYGSPITS